MYTTREQRRNYLKQWKKNNPRATRQEIELVRKSMAQLGKQEHEKRTQSLIEAGILKPNNLVTEIVNDELDFVPNDLK